MSVNAVGKSMPVAHALLPRRDGNPRQSKEANPMEPLGKDHFAASGNTVGKAAEGSVNGIMAVVKSPEVAVAAVATAAGAVGGAAIGALVGRGAGAVQGAKFGATFAGGIGLAGAGGVMIADKNLNTYAKTVVAPLLIATGAGISIGAFKGAVTEYDPSIALGLAQAAQGAKVGSIIGTAGTTVATAIKGIADIFETFKARF